MASSDPSSSKSIYDINQINQSNQSIKSINQINQAAFVLIVLFKVNLTLFTISAQSLELSQVYSMLYTSLSSIQVILKVRESFGRISILMMVSMLLSALCTPVSLPPTSLPIYHYIIISFCCCGFVTLVRIIHITLHYIRSHQIRTEDVISVGNS